MEKEVKQIKKITTEFLAKMTFEAETSVKTDGKIFYVNIDMKEPSFLIGKRGETLRSLEYLLRQMINRKAGEMLYTVVDIANYKNRKREEVERVAKKYIKILKKTKRAQVLPTMNAYERHVVHTLVVEEEGMESESISEEPNRRVVIRTAKTKVEAKK